MVFSVSSVPHAPARERASRSGPVFVKLAQWAATRPDFVPEAWCQVPGRKVSKESEGEARQGRENGCPKTPPGERRPESGPRIPVGALSVPWDERRASRHRFRASREGEGVTGRGGGRGCDSSGPRSAAGSHRPAQPQAHPQDPRRGSSWDGDAATAAVLNILDGPSLRAKPCQHKFTCITFPGQCSTQKG